MLTSLHSPGPYLQNALQSFGHRRQYQGVRSLFCASSAATALLGSSTLRGCALPRSHDFLLLAPQFILSLFPILVTDSSSYLFPKKKKGRPKVNIWKRVTVVKTSAVRFSLLVGVSGLSFWVPLLFHPVGIHIYCISSSKKFPSFFAHVWRTGFYRTVSVL